MPVEPLDAKTTIGDAWACKRWRRSDSSSGCFATRSECAGAAGGVQSSCVPRPKAIRHCDSGRSVALASEVPAGPTRTAPTECAAYPYD